MGRIIACGKEVAGLSAGDRIFAPCGHAAYHRVDTAGTPVVVVPDEVAAEDAVYVRFCAVSMTTLRTTRARPGDGVAIFGLGIIGTMAAQVFQASGYEVVGFDPEESRRKRALACGLRLALPPAGLVDGWRSALGKIPCKLAVDTSGAVEAVRSATELADIGAEIVLVEVPWKSSTALSAAALTQATFTKYLHLRGGWEWALPTLPARFAPGSVLENLQHAMRLMARGPIQAAPLRSHLVPPDEAQAVYNGLLGDKDTYHSSGLRLARSSLTAAMWRRHDPVHAYPTLHRNANLLYASKPVRIHGIIQKLLFRDLDRVALGCAPRHYPASPTPPTAACRCPPVGGARCASSQSS